jgi:RNA recognition motif-containing protein
MKLFIGNIDPKTTEEELRKTFSQYGDVQEVKIVFDKLTRESRHFGFVKMGDPESALSAIKKLNGKYFKEKKLQVNQARSQVRARKGINRRNGPPKYR